jgi:pyruvate/2-oxoglutarate dehydrogenase complex dihydrolipoamide acyltransferase (E2) component
MICEVLLPQLGFSVPDGRLVEWLADDGSDIKKGAPLFSLESDKAIEEIEAPGSGRLRIIKPAGETYNVGELLAVIE